LRIRKDSSKRLPPEEKVDDRLTTWIDMGSLSTPFLAIIEKIKNKLRRATCGNNIKHH